ncbi:MAG: glycosyltransferase [Flavobacteriaceae bacterium]|nr:glycosyltransferase [Flavobacteriaceae bacterium]
MKKIIVSVTNDLTTDQRVHRVCATLSDLNYDVLLVGRKLNNSFPLTRTYQTKRFQLLFNKGFLFYAEYNIRLFIFLMFKRKNILLANDVDTLLPNFLIGKLFNIPVVFDSHELFSEVPELINRPKIKFFWRKLEDLLIPKIKYKYTVCKSIADYYKSNYNTSFEVIRNVPFRKSINNILKSFVILNKNAIIYQGALNKGRGLELIINTMLYLENATLYIVGDGDLTNELKQLVVELKLTEKVIFLGKITPDKLPTITSQAAIGLSIEEDLGLNYRFALPNKLFDYIQAKIPVLVSDLPEMKQVVNQYKIGEIITDRNPKAVAKTIDWMFEHRVTYQKNLEIAANELCWELEEKKLAELVNKSYLLDR